MYETTTLSPSAMGPTMASGPMLWSALSLDSPSSDEEEGDAQPRGSSEAPMRTAHVAKYR